MSTNFEHIEFTDTRPGYENRSGQFITVPKQVMRDPNLSDAERTVLLYLHDRAGNPNQSLYKEKDKKFCRVAFPSFETIAEDTVRSVRQAKDIVKSLRIKGYVKVTKQKTTKGEHNLYTIQFPASYQALDKVNTFTLFVATGKNLAKDEATVPTTEASANTRTGGCANTRTQSSANTRTVNSSLETAPIETGTSTFLTERSQEETDSNLPRENQEVPLVETNIPGQDYKEILVVEEVPLVETLDEVDLSSGYPLVDEVEANASPSISPSGDEDDVPDYSSVTSGMENVNEVDLETKKTSGPSEEFKARMIRQAQEREKARIEGNKTKKSQTTGQQYLRYTNPLEEERRAMFNEMRREFDR